MIEVVNNLEHLQALRNTFPAVLVIVFSARDWCVPCQKLAIHIEAAAERLPNIKFVEVDIDQSEDIRKAYNIMSVPTVIYCEKDLFRPVLSRTSVNLVKELS